METELLSVTAHGLLSKVSVISGAASLLTTVGATLDESDVQELIAIIDRESKSLAVQLDELVRGLPASLLPPH